jgi:plasmid stabilization system protein ParE
MLQSKYQFTVDAENDLRKILSYTLENFGKRQTLKYSRELNFCLNKLGNQKRLIKEFKIKKHKVQVLHCQKHYIFGLIRKELPVLIIAIFHERMDLMRRLQKRL